MMKIVTVLCSVLLVGTEASPVDFQQTKNDPFELLSINFKEEWFKNPDLSDNLSQPNKTDLFDAVCLTQAKIISTVIGWLDISGVAAIINNDYTKILNGLQRNSSDAQQSKNLTELFVKTKRVKAVICQDGYLKGYNDILLFTGMFLITMTNINAPRYFFNDTNIVQKCENRTLDFASSDLLLKKAADDYQKRRIEIYTLVQLLEEDVFMKDISQEFLDQEEKFLSFNKSLVRETIRMKLMATLRAQFGFESSLISGVQLTGDLWALSDEKIGNKLKAIPEIVLTEEGMKEYKKRLEHYLKEAEQFDEVDKEEYEVENIDGSLYVKVPEMFEENEHDDYDNSFEQEIDEKPKRELRPLEKIAQDDQEEIKGIMSLEYLASLYDNHTDPQEKLKKFTKRFSYREDVRNVLMAGFIYRMLLLSSDSEVDTNYFTKECDIYGPALYALYYFHGSGFLGSATRINTPVWDIINERDQIRRVKVTLDDGKIKNFNISELIDHLSYSDTQEKRLKNIKHFLDLILHMSYSAITNDLAFVDFMKSYLNTATGKPNKYLKCFESSVSSFDKFSENLRKESKISKVYSYVFLKMLEEDRHMKPINQEQINDEIKRLKAEYENKVKIVKLYTIEKNPDNLPKELVEYQKKDLQDKIEQLRSDLQTKLDFLSNMTLIQIKTRKRLMEQEIRKYKYIEKGTSKIDRDITASVINKLDFGAHHNLIDEAEIPYYKMMFSEEGLKEFQRRTQDLLVKKKLIFV